MKAIPFLILALLAFTSCEDDDDAPRIGLIGTWQLDAVLTDPGDGSGEFIRVDSDRLLFVETDSTYASNSIICNFSTETNMLTVLSTGSYDLAAGTLVPDDCPSVPPTSTEIGLELIGEELILTYLCIEGCQHRYLRR